MPNILAVGAYGIPAIVMNCVLTFGLALIIAMVYKATHRGLSYSQSFVFTLVIMSMIVTMIMMIIGNSLARAFGLLGAFSLIRFRTVVKDTKDIAYLFFALGAGMAIGTGNYLIAFVSAAVILVAIAVLHRVNFGAMRQHTHLLSFVTVGGSANASYEAVFKKYLKTSLLLNINSKRDGQAAEITYQVTLADEAKGKTLVEELSSAAGVENVHLITSREDVEY